MRKTLIQAMFLCLTFPLFVSKAVAFDLPTECHSEENCTVYGELTTARLVAITSPIIVRQGTFSGSGKWILRGNQTLDVFGVSVTFEDIFRAETVVYNIDSRRNPKLSGAHIVPLSGTRFFNNPNDPNNPDPDISFTSEVFLRDSGMIFDYDGGGFYISMDYPVSGYLLGDLDGNCSIGTGDMTYIAAHDGESGVNIKGDLNDDGVVSYRDLFVLWSNWGDSCPF